ncbi:MAG: phosphotransferase [Deltaproteobacteria bacterium]|nr:phosphotransferase [Deltaproteobacteria bacterium]
MKDRLPFLDTALRQALGVDGDDVRVTMLKGDASSRSYHRVEIPGHDPPTAVVMELAVDPLKSDEFTDWDPPEYPFTLVQRYLARGGLPVPRIHAARPGDGWLVLDDLGDATLESVLAGLPVEGWTAWYEKAVDLLARWQDWWHRSRELNPVAGRRFSRKLLAWELDHYVEWGLEARLGITLDASERSALDEAFRPLLDGIASIPVGLVHRDYQSRNLMVQDGGLWIIDFQDALMGPVVYDVVALLCDSYVAIPERLQESMLERLRLQVDPESDAHTWRTWFDMQAVQRKLKDAGRFVFIDRVKGNPDFLPHVGQSLEHVRGALGRLPDLAPLEDLLGGLGGLDEH